MAALAWKDLRIELRSGEILWTMTFFAVMVVLAFSFAFLQGGEIQVSMTPGILWASVMFSGTVGLSRAFDREREGDTMRALLLCPAPRAALFLGKAMAVAALVLVVVLWVASLSVFLFAAPLFAQPMVVITALLLGAVGFSVVGAVFAAMLLRVRARDVLLPVVLYPILVPLLIAGTRATAESMQGAVDVAWWWVKFLAAYDALFVVAAMWIFDSLVTE
jgi:heme exporter protein CcmB